MPTPAVNAALLYDASSRRWLHFDDPVDVLLAHDLRSVTDVIAEAEARVRNEGLFAAGFVAYEAAPAFDPALVARPASSFPLVWLGLYREPRPMTFPAPPRDADASMAWHANIDRAEYDSAFRRVKDEIAKGNTYQVNLSFRLRSRIAMEPWDLFVRMIHGQTFGYGAFVDTGRWAICSASPELFFSMENGVLVSRPMKGTLPRALTQAEDSKQPERLAQSAKNRAENVMIVDMVRNDMGRIAETGSVHVDRLFEIEKFPTVWQMTSQVRCRTDAGLLDTLRALFPAASITGAPKARTMRIIRELESAPRHVYTGAVGFFGPGGRALFNVAIRTVLVDCETGEAEYGIGGGIVWDSRNAEEFDECYAKARVLTQPVPDFDLLETILWRPGEGYGLLDAHLARLAESAVYFSRDVDVDGVRAELEALASGFPACSHRVRLLVGARRTRDRAGRASRRPAPALSCRSGGTSRRFLQPVSLPQDDDACRVRSR